MTFKQPSVQSLDFSNNFHTTVDVLRLDQLHPVISGNKWYKLKYYLAEATILSKHTIVTFGGAYSNHIVATAAAAQQAGLKSVGIIRGERPAQLSPTLIDAEKFGMQLLFISRSAYREKQLTKELFQFADENECYHIPEGGFGKMGMMGAAEILDQPLTDYSTIIAAVGTGTTLAGLTHAALPQQKLLGVSVLKNNLQLQHDVQSLLDDSKTRFDINHHFHFGGYAKYNQTLIDFMNDFYEQHALPSDFVYTGKLFFAVSYLIRNGYFQQEKILVIHSGGLQGNRSLPKGTLIF